MRRFTRRSALALLLAASVTGSLAITPIAANAASDFDSFLNVTPNLYVYTDGSAKTETMDISTTWWEDYKETYALRVAQNIGFPTNFVTEFEDIMESEGSWGVFTQESSNGIRITILGTHDPDAYCGFEGDAIDGIYRCVTHAGYGYVRSEYFTHNSFGSNGCMGSFDYRCSTNGMNIYQAPVVIADGGPDGYYATVIPNTSLPSTKFFFMNFDLVYPSGYEGVMLPTAYVPPPPKYVAMGDSYSSGEGSFNYDYDTISSACHRSQDSYAFYLTQGHHAVLGDPNLVACSGASTADLFNSNIVNTNESAQLGSVNTDTQYVTITIGGNDLGFAGIMGACADHALNTGYGCSTRTDLNLQVNIGLDALAGAATTTVYAPGSGTSKEVYSIVSVLNAIKSNAAVGAKIYIAGYPHLFGDSTTTFEYDDDAPGDYKCYVGAGSPYNIYFSYEDTQWLNDKTDAINAVIENAVTYIDDANITYVAPFNNHGHCDNSVSYLNEVSLVGSSPESESMHPTELGMQSGYGNIFNSSMFPS